MNKLLLDKKLQHLAGHIVISSAEEKRDYQLLSKSLSNSALPDDNKLLRKSNFSIENADLFFPETIPKKRLDSLDKLARDKIASNKEPESRVFVREVPVREKLIHASVPDWAAGAKVSQSIGPFTHKDGRKFWYDFFPIVKLLALYIQGTPEPVLLFKTTQRKTRTTLDNNPIRISQAQNFSLAKGSIWINSKFLATGAPAGSYTGLAIKGGKISLNNNPVNQDGKLLVSANTVISVQLKLDQEEPAETNEKNPYGIDARTMKLLLPQTLSFHFSSQGRTIDDVADAQWNLYGQSLKFKWDDQSQTMYDPILQRIIIPLTASSEQLQIRNSKSKFNTLNNAARIIRSAWALPVAIIDTSQATEASGTGEMLVQTKAGLVNTWQGLTEGGINLSSPAFIVSPGQILVTDMTKGNPQAQQSMELWQDEINTYGSKVELSFPSAAAFFYVANATGNELVMTFANADFQIDRPVKVDGEPPAVRSLNSLFLLAVNSTTKLIYLFDDNLIQDAAQLSDQDPVNAKPMALALSNALFRVSKVNGCLIFGTVSDDYRKIENGFLFLTFGLYAYLPTLPDPYAANLGPLRNQIRGRTQNKGSFRGTAIDSGSSITSWLVCRVKWLPPSPDNNHDNVEVSFHFAPLTQQFAGISLEESEANSENDSIDSIASSLSHNATSATVSKQRFNDDNLQLNNEISNAITAHNVNATRKNNTTEPVFLTTATTTSTLAASRKNKPLPDYEAGWNRVTGRTRKNLFALLDVSTNADLYGISFNLLSKKNHLPTTHQSSSTDNNTFPFQVKGMDVVSQGQNVKAFTVPQISWEPLINLTPPEIPGDPPAGFNFYPDDGGPMQILNNSEDTVALAPLPLTNYLLKNFQAKSSDFAAYSFLTLPFGLKALAVLQNQYQATKKDGTVDTRKGTEVLLNAEEFEDQIKGGLQLQLNAGEALIDGESDMFVGSTVQLNNVLDFTGTSQGDSTLGRTVTEIFNDEFLLKPFDLIRPRGVPLTRIDLSGYGASTFSNWLNPTAAFAQTSQAKFDVFVGRCAHEIIQVKSIIYPWAIKVVRTITIFRVGSGYVYRFDSGWRAESNGEFDFRYFVNEDPEVKIEKPSPFEIHPGIVKNLYNVQNIIETDEIAVAEGQMISDKIVDEKGLYVDNTTTGNQLEYRLQPVYFDADIEIENAISGFTSKKINGKNKDLVPAKKILGYVQSAPRGIPINKETLKQLVSIQLGSIGGAIDCEIDLADSGQKMRLNRFDFNNSLSSNGADAVFVAAGRGNVLLPKDGSWTLIKHQRGTGEVSPVPGNLSVPVIRQGKLIKDNDKQKLDIPIADVLLRISNPSELLRAPNDDTINFGFLQNTDTQKALFLTPAFELGQTKLLSKTPPLFVDSFRIVNSKAIFPNIGDAENNLGEAISLNAKGTEFLKGNLQDLGKDVLQLMDVTNAAENAQELGYKLLKKADETFDLPDTEFELIDVGDGNFRIYIEYEQKNGNVTSKGDLDFNINSLANNVAENWKSKMGNIGLVIDLAGIDRLMTIRGNWDSKKGSEAAYPQPEIKFSDELQPVIDILEILQQLQGEDYAGAVANGLKLAMSNKAGTWEYKFEASKEIPVIRFPIPDAIYNDPITPLKLEAGLTLGAYFNAALMVTNDANELLPSAGGILGFYGRLSVMCVSLSAATVYAIGQVNLDIAADTKIGPSLRMKFGFGAQIVIGLPVAGNVSVLFVVGIEIFAATGQISITAFMLFEGHAEILGGIVAITIRIEAMGTVSKITNGNDSRTDLACQVTFGLDISIFLIININFETSWDEQRRIA